MNKIEKRKWVMQMWILLGGSVLCIGVLVAFMVYGWRKKNNRMDFEMWATAYYSLFFYSTWYVILMIPGVYLDVWYPVVSMSLMYPFLVLLYFTVKRLMIHWKELGKAWKKNVPVEERIQSVWGFVWLLILVTYILFCTILFKVEGFIGLMLFVLLVITKEQLMKSRATSE